VIASSQHPSEWHGRPARGSAANEPRGRESPAAAKTPRVAGFRTKLLIAMMLVVSAITALVLYFAERRLAANAADELQRAFQTELAALHNAQSIRLTALAERCRSLGSRSRFSAALEEAPELLYPNAEFELRDIMKDRAAAERGGPPLRASFYRFLDARGAVIQPPKPRVVGALEPAEEAQLALPRLSDRQQVGYLARKNAGGPAALLEVIASPIFSLETGEVLSTLVLGFEPLELGGGAGMRSGIWSGGRLHSATLAPSAEPAIARDVARALAQPVPLAIEGAPFLLFSKALNPGSLFAPAFEVCVFPLAELAARQRELRWQVLGAGALLLLFGLVASHLVAARLSAPVEKLAVDSERSARFSADASHQLKTPVTVLRAGLEELLTRDNLTPGECDQISALVHQTYRLSSLIDDLLLLSRMDAGRLKLDLAPLDLTALIDAALDDLGAVPDDHGVRIETELPAALCISGEKRYTAIILQNLLENARKYNVRGGRIRIRASIEGDAIAVRVANTGRPIAPAAQAHIFERFHRGAIGENVPGYGLGLNLARELARLHNGDLRLVRSDEQGTEFEVRFRVASPPAPATGESA